MRLLIPLLFLAGCVDTTEDNLSGKLVRVEVVTSSDDCLPARFSGDAGLQFFGEREDGGVAFTMGQNAQYGPAPDGGLVQSVQQQLLPPANNGRAVVGRESGCEGSFSAWERGDAGLNLAQDLPRDGHLPQRARLAAVEGLQVDAQLRVHRGRHLRAALRADLDRRRDRVPVLKTVFKSPVRAEAELIRARLESAGFHPAITGAAQHSSLMPMLMEVESEVAVPESEQESAEEFLPESRLKLEGTEASGEIVEGSVCPVHEQPAVAVCDRCGTFLCAQCGS